MIEMELALLSFLELDAWDKESREDMGKEELYLSDEPNG